MIAITSRHGLVIAAVGGVVFVGMIIGMFVDSERAEGAIRGELAGETEEPGVLEVDLPEGEHVVWVIDGRDMPHDPGVRLDVEILAEDGSEVPSTDPGNRVTYQDPGTSSELFMAARFDVERDGPHRIRVEELAGSYPVERIGVGRQPSFGHPTLFAFGAMAAFVVAGTGFAMATGRGFGALTGVSSRPPAGRAR